MKCPKCQGSMVRERYHNHEEDSLSLSVYGWHCIFCGCVVDPVIMTNRARMSEKQALAKK